MDIFKFEISEKLRVYKKNSLNLEVTLKTSNFKAYLTELNTIILDMDKNQVEIFRIMNLFSKGKNYIKPEMASAEKNQLMISMNSLQKNFIQIHPEKKAYIIEKCRSILEELLQSINNHSYEQVFIKLNEFCTEITTRNQRKIDMCEKLKLLEDKVLKAICFFDEQGFHTHFTKYYLNLEHFSENLHEILSLEVENCLVKNYQELEKEHFDLFSRYTNGKDLTLEELNVINEKIFDNYQKIESFNYIFLKAQIRHDQIRENIQVLVQEQQNISKKFKEIYAEMNYIFDKRNLYDKYNIKTMFLFSLNLFYNMTLSEFFAFPSSGLPQIFLDSSKIKKNDIRKNILLSNLELIEPEIADRIKKTIIHDFKTKEQYDICDYAGSFLTRKAKKHVFDNNQYYSHELAIFAFIPSEVGQTLNRFMRSSGYDKVFVNQYNVRHKIEVFSLLSGITLDCEVYINFANYQINQNAYTLKKIA